MLRPARRPLQNTTARRTCAALVAWFLALSLAGCAHASSGSSVLERYDDLRGELRQVGFHSTRVAVDVRVLGNDLRRGHRLAERRDAETLKHDAGALARGAGRCGNVVRSLVVMQGPGPVRSYLRAISGTLTAEWYEGKALAGLANVMRSDPLVLVPANAAKFSTLQRRADRFAAVATGDAELARSLQSRHHALFRYVPLEKHGGHA